MSRLSIKTHAIGNGARMFGPLFWFNDQRFGLDFHFYLHTVYVMWERN